MNELPAGWSVEWREEVDSTNERLRKEPSHHGRVIVADRQLAGRGRRGAPWHSVPGESLTFSVFLKPSAPIALWPRLSLAAGLALAETLERLGYAPGIKWPNDVWLGGRKLAGILVESSDDGAIIGMGLNLNDRDFPDALEATSLALEDGREWEREEVLGMLLPRIDGWSRRIDGGFAEIVSGVGQRCVLTGERVRLRTPAGETEGVVRGIGGSGGLLLDRGGEVSELIQADEVRVVG